MIGYHRATPVRTQGRRGPMFYVANDSAETVHSIGSASSSFDIGHLTSQTRLCSGGACSSSAPATHTPLEGESSAVALFRFLRSVRPQLAELRDGKATSLPQSLESTMRSLLDALRPEDLGVDVLACLAPLRGPRAAGVGYQEVFHCREMTVCIFVVRAGASIPLHDHPGMHVFGRLLFGRMQVLSVDVDMTSSELRPRAILRGEAVLGPEPVSYSLGPSSGNLHELKAIDDCAFFDVLTPPYDENTGRDCTYYKLEPCAGGHVLVPAIPHFWLESIPYRGPKFNEL